MVASSLSLLYAQENNEGERPVVIEKENEQELSSNPLSNIFQNKNDTVGKSKLPGIKKYIITNILLDSTFLDTTLSIKKHYKFNYLRKDNFELIEFSNSGHTYNKLSYESNSSLNPNIGAQAKHYNYMDANDVDYYHVATPFTELMYRSAFVQGQLLDALFSVNTSPQFNFTIGRKGLRSLGNYQHFLSKKRKKLNYNIHLNHLM